TWCEPAARHRCGRVRGAGRRGYDDATRRALLKIAWPSARGALERQRPGEKMSLAVGLRGVLMYGAAAAGATTDREPPAPSLETDAYPDRFEAFFKGLPPAARPSPLTAAASPTRGGENVD